MSKFFLEVNAKSSIMMIDERLDEQLVEQFPAVPLTDECGVKIKFSPEVHRSS